jgi:hypothetical protein
MNVWAGVLPLSIHTGQPVDDDRLAEGIKPPDNIHNYSRKRR